MRTAHLDIINTIENDPVLQALSIKDGIQGSTLQPPELATPLNANTPHTTFAELGAIFDDAQSKSLGGINADNLPAIQADLQAVHDGLLTLMQNHPQLFGGATGIHASTIVDQINLQLTNFDHQYGLNPDAAKATNDNFLDITDIVAGDPNLANMASANGVTGWTDAPATDVVPVRYQDNADQTNFWADFIASGNTLGAKAEQLVSTGSAHEIKAFIHTLQGWENNVQNFDAAQGGIFEARFDNELLGQELDCGCRRDGDDQGPAESRRGAGQGGCRRIPCQCNGCVWQQCPAQRRHLQSRRHDHCRCAWHGNGSAASCSGLAPYTCFSGHSGSHHCADDTKRGESASGAGYNRCCRDR